MLLQQRCKLRCSNAKLVINPTNKRSAATKLIRRFPKLTRRFVFLYDILGPSRLLVSWVFAGLVCFVFSCAAYCCLIASGLPIKKQLSELLFISAQGVQVLVFKIVVGAPSRTRMPGRHVEKSLRCILSQNDLVAVVAASCALGDLRSLVIAAQEPVTRHCLQGRFDMIAVVHDAIRLRIGSSEDLGAALADGGRGCLADVVHELGEELYHRGCVFKRRDSRASIALHPAFSPCSGVSPGQLRSIVMDFSARQCPGVDENAGILAGARWDALGPRKVRLSRRIGIESGVVVKLLR